MTTLLAEAADAQAWAISAPRQGKAIQVSTATYKDKTAALLLTPRSELGSVTTPWPPNVFRGTGQEARQTITFEITPELYEQCQRLESAILEKAREVVPNADALSSSRRGATQRCSRRRYTCLGAEGVALWTRTISRSTRQQSGEADPCCQL